MISGYIADIGDLEPAPPGMETGIDPMLRRGLDGPRRWRPGLRTAASGER